ncbi:MAG TPA: phosphatidylserine/phosphatidylglycerophosphate/cardiolipin synthase family protein [Bryobacteraceae bacterium]|nr:phosphatidylserine/phosphatidylglycerophosphate/cardiolipin synthase family protein [Bryobacteraceae bacterium]
METLILVFAIAGLATQLVIVVLALFEPPLAYEIAEFPGVPLGSKEFARVLAVVSDAHLHSDSAVEVLTNGTVFYEAELTAIRSARSHICLEAYIFRKGNVAATFLSALTERARNGVEVRLVLDAVGSFNTPRGLFAELIAAGGRVCWYMPFRWYNLSRFNNRTHREMLIVDGTVAFVGGAGVADHWYKGDSRDKAWRDTMVCVRGSAIASLQSIFAENWLESSGELLTASRYFPVDAGTGTAQVMVIDSTPSYGRATRARTVFQVLIASASRQIHLTTPYFLPDWSVRQALINAMRRGVEVKIIVPGKHHDHLLTRRSSRRLYGSLLENGAEIYEYQRSMIHTKMLVVDGLWSVVGSTNFDSRSFGINDEVNVAALDEPLAARLEQDFEADLLKAEKITFAAWRRRPPSERVHEWLGWILERQE